MISYCGALARFVKEICCCSEAGDWSPMTEEQIKRELEKDRKKRNMSRKDMAKEIKRKLMNVGSKKSKANRQEEPTLESLTHENQEVQSKEYAYAFGENFRFDGSSVGQNSRLSYSTCDGNWSLSRKWKNSLNYDPIYAEVKKSRERNYTEHIKRLKTKLQLIQKYKNRCRDSKLLKEQLRYDRNIKRHIRIRFMLSLRLKRYMRKPTLPSLKKQTLEDPQVGIVVPKRCFPKTVEVFERSLEVVSPATSFGTTLSGKALFDVNEARNEMVSKCHGDIERDSEKMYAGNLR